MYFEGARADFVALLDPMRHPKVLEIGCGAGATGALALAQGKCTRYCGVELTPEAAASARSHISEVVLGDVERVDLPWRPGSFDALLLSEVLEHLINPEDTLRMLYKLLRPEALVLASSPNIAHYRVLAMLLRGRFTPTDYGVMDRSHLRWFTPFEYRRIFEDAGFTVLRVSGHGDPGPRVRALSRVTPKFAEHLLWRQVEVEATRGGRESSVRR